jgi:hypothetical protein
MSIGTISTFVVADASAAAACKARGAFMASSRPTCQHLLHHLLVWGRVRTLVAGSFPPCPWRTARHRRHCPELQPESAALSKENASMGVDVSSPDKRTAQTPTKRRPQQHPPGLPPPSLAAGASARHVSSPRALPPGTPPCLRADSSPRGEGCHQHRPIHAAPRGPEDAHTPPSPGPAGQLRGLAQPRGCPDAPLPKRLETAVLA